MSREICIGSQLRITSTVCYYLLQTTTYIKTYHVGTHIIETFVGR